MSRFRKTALVLLSSFASAIFTAASSPRGRTLGSSAARWSDQNRPTNAVRNALIRGAVRDDSGAPLPGAAVTSISVSSGSVRTVVADERGRFELPDLDPGEYRVRAALPGFGGFDERLVLKPGESRALSLTLRMAPLRETVTVTRAALDRSDVPNPVSVVTGAAVQEFQRRASPAEAFIGVPGFFVENRRNFGYSGGLRFAIRAPLPRLNLRGLQLVQDGVPMTMADGTTEPSNIDLGSLGRAEILRGPSSLLYGNSGGGVISLRTEFPSSAPLRVEPDFQSGSYGYRRQQIKAQGTRGAVAYLFNASRFTTDGFREHSRAEVRRANLGVRAALSPSTEIRGTFNLYDLPFGENSSTIDRAAALHDPRSVRALALTECWGEKTTQGQGGVTLERRFTGGASFRATAWGLWRNVWNSIPSRIVDVNRVAGGFRSEVGGPLALLGRRVDWTAGLDLSAQHDLRNEYRNLGVAAPGGRTREGPPLLGQLEQVLSLSPFVRLAVPMGDRWKIVGGLRYDRFRFAASDRLLSDGDQSGRRRLGAFSPLLGVTYRASDALSLFGNVGTSFMTPTTVELSNRPTGEGGFNEDLGPERLRSVEVGARGGAPGGTLRYEVAVYTSRLRDVIVRFERADEQEFYRNAGSASRRGLEAQLEWAPRRDLDLRVAYTYQDFKFGRFVAPEGDFSGHREPCAPPHQLFASVAYRAPFGLSSFARVRSVGAYPVDNANAFSNWAYTVVDLRFGFETGAGGVSIRPFVGLDNVLDVRYNSSAIANSSGNRFYEPAPGREVYAGVTIGAELFGRSAPDR